MSGLPGSAASSLIEVDGGQLKHPHPSPLPEGEGAVAAAQPVRSRYLQRLTLRREADEVRRLIGYGLTLGWIFFFVGSFLLCCVPSRLDWLWTATALAGVGHLVLAVLVPQLLAWPEWVWMTVARWQGHVVMTVLLTIVYYLLLWPASWFSRRYQRGFFRWTALPPGAATAWQPIDLAGDELLTVANSRSRSLPLLLAGVIGFFFRRGNYVLLPILILLLLLGLVLFIVQSSVLAPFIYPLF